MSRVEWSRLHHVLLSVQNFQVSIFSSMVCSKDPSGIIHIHFTSINVVRVHKIRWKRDFPKRGVRCHQAFTAFSRETMTK